MDLQVKKRRTLNVAYLVSESYVIDTVSAIIYNRVVLGFASTDVQRVLKIASAAPVKCVVVFICMTEATVLNPVSIRASMIAIAHLASSVVVGFDSSSAYVLRLVLEKRVNMMIIAGLENTVVVMAYVPLLASESLVATFLLTSVDQARSVVILVNTPLEPVQHLVLASHVATHIGIGAAHLVNIVAAIRNAAQIALLTVTVQLGVKFAAIALMDEVDVPNRVLENRANTNLTVLQVNIVVCLVEHVPQFVPTRFVFLIAIARRANPVVVLITHKVFVVNLVLERPVGMIPIAHLVNIVVVLIEHVPRVLVTKANIVFTMVTAHMANHVVAFMEVLISHVLNLVLVNHVKNIVIAHPVNIVAPMTNVL